MNSTIRKILYNDLHEMCRDWFTQARGAKDHKIYEAKAAWEIYLYLRIISQLC